MQCSAVGYDNTMEDCHVALLRCKDRRRLDPDANTTKIFSAARIGVVQISDFDETPNHNARKHGIGKRATTKGAICACMCQKNVARYVVTIGCFPQEPTNTHTQINVHLFLSLSILSTPSPLLRQLVQDDSHTAPRRKGHRHTRRQYHIQCPHGTSHGRLSRKSLGRPD